MCFVSKESSVSQSNNSHHQSIPLKIWRHAWSSPRKCGNISSCLILPSGSAFPHRFNFTRRSLVGGCSWPPQRAFCQWRLLERVFFLLPFIDQRSQTDSKLAKEWAYGMHRGARLPLVWMQGICLERTTHFCLWCVVAVLREDRKEGISSVRVLPHCVLYQRQRLQAVCWLGTTMLASY